MRAANPFARKAAILLTLALAATAITVSQLPTAQAQQQGRRGGPVAGVYKTRVTPHWSADSTKFWYKNDLRGGNKEFVLVEVEPAAKKGPAFDHEKLAGALGKTIDREVNAAKLPFDAIEFVDDGKAIRFTVADATWKCDLATYAITKSDGGPVTDPTANAALIPDSWEQQMRLAMANDPFAPDPEVLAYEDSLAQQDDAQFENPQAQTQPAQQAQGNGRGARGGRGGRGGAAGATADGRGGQGRGGFNRGGPVTSADGKFTASVRDNNIFIKSADGPETQVTKDGEANFAYSRLSFSPDGSTLVAWRMEPGDRKEVYRLQSSPPGQNGATGGGVGRAVLQTQVYALPGDKFDSYELNLIDIASQKDTRPADVGRLDFGAGGGDPNPAIRWKKDGIHFTYEKFDRGHQRVRIIEVNAKTGETRNILDEQSKTFIWSAHHNFSSEGQVGRIINYLRNEDEIIYASEKDGWRHLYLVDAKAGEMKPITKGEWVCRGIQKIDQDARQIWFSASGIYPDQDPYLLHYGRVNFDGTGLVWLTEGNGQHTVTMGDNGSFSPNNKYFVDSYSRVDMPPVTELRNATTGKLVLALEKADIEIPLNPPEVFVAKGRDGKTDIWGTINRPRNFDPSKKYPILEDIYAGPQDSFVPKTFSPASRYQALNNLGFIVVKIDGMGTANRSKAFHDVCWQNIKDAGFEDRILWMKAAAAKYNYMDLDKVGIYGTSAGGQNACAAVLFHPEFYKVAVANCGCHDNRMDKASWNEQWMGYPVGPWYSASSNIDNANRLVGRLQLVLGEVDSNVPVESTYRLVNALVQNRKDFEFVVIPGANHGAGSPITQTKLQDFFQRYLLGVEPPNHNAVTTPANPNP